MEWINEPNMTDSTIGIEACLVDCNLCFLYVCKTYKHSWL